MDKKCIAEGCPDQAHAKDMCRTHYNRVWRHGLIGLLEKTPRQRACKLHDKISSAEAELKAVLTVYENAYGEARYTWGQKRRDLMLQITLLKEQEEERAARPKKSEHKDKVEV